MDELGEKVTEPYAAFKEYPPGYYRRKNFLGSPHPSNVCSFVDNGYSVLVSLNYEPTSMKYSGEFKDRLFYLNGYTVTVWSKRSQCPVISVSETATSYEKIAPLIKQLQFDVEVTCHHENSKPLPQRQNMVHEYICLDCGQRWGYDSSG